MIPPVWALDPWVLIRLKNHCNEDKFTHILEVTGVLQFMAFAISLAAPDTSAPRAKLSAAEIVDRNVAAETGCRPGLRSKLCRWRGKWAPGEISGRSCRPNPGCERRSTTGAVAQAAGRGGSTAVPAGTEAPPRTAVGTAVPGQTAIQVFDGINGWKVRPFLNRNEVEPFTAEELKTASMQTELDGSLPRAHRLNSLAWKRSRAGIPTNLSST